MANDDNKSCITPQLFKQTCPSMSSLIEQDRKSYGNKIQQEKLFQRRQTTQKYREVYNELLTMALSGNVSEDRLNELIFRNGCDTLNNK